MNKCVVRCHHRNGAVFSHDDIHRYLLWRAWGGDPGDSIYPIHEAAAAGLKTAAFVGLNPSTATESQNDPTVKRCIDFAREWGFDGMYMLNIFSIRATDPKVMRASSNPNGYDRDNDEHILLYGNLADLTVGCWGSHGVYRGRGFFVEALLMKMYEFGRTKTGHPLHPLYLRKSLKPYFRDERTDTKTYLSF